MTKNLNRKLLAISEKSKQIHKSHSVKTPFITLNPLEILARQKAQRVERLQNCDKSIQKQKLFFTRRKN